MRYKIKECYEFEITYPTDAYYLSKNFIFINIFINRRYKEWLRAIPNNKGLIIDERISSVYLDENLKNIINKYLKLLTFT